MPYDEQFREAAAFGYILHHLMLARKEATDRGHAELAENIREVESDARTKRNLILDSIGVTEEEPHDPTTD